MRTVRHFLRKSHSPCPDGTTACAAFSDGTGTCVYWSTGEAHVRLEPHPL